MDIDLRVGDNYLIYAIGMIIAVGLSIYWIIKRRKKQKGLQDPQALSQGSYSGAQKLGIVGLILFIIPVIFIFNSYIMMGIGTLLLIIFRLISLPDIIVHGLMYVVVPMSYCVAIIGTYWICEFIWPQKSESKNNIPEVS